MCLLERPLNGNMKILWDRNFCSIYASENGPTLDVTTTGRYKLIVDFAGVCLSEGDVFIEFAPPITINNMPSPLVLCDSDNDGFASFDRRLPTWTSLAGTPTLL